MVSGNAPLLPTRIVRIDRNRRVGVSSAAKGTKKIGIILASR
jgi:hypothetical protein